MLHQNSLPNNDVVKVGEACVKHIKSIINLERKMNYENGIQASINSFSGLNKVKNEFYIIPLSYYYRSA